MALIIFDVTLKSDLIKMFLRNINAPFNLRLTSHKRDWNTIFLKILISQPHWGNGGRVCKKYY